MVIYTDGAYSPIKDKGGWAFYCPQYHIRVCDSVMRTTNNRMELQAVIKALEFVDESALPDKEIIIYSDSKYVVETMNGHYKQKTNLDLWDRIRDLINGLYNKQITFEHIKGHTKEKNGNSVADMFANLVSQL